MRNFATLTIKELHVITFNVYYSNFYILFSNNFCTRKSVNKYRKSIRSFISHQNIIFFRFDFPVLWLLLLFVDDKSTTSLPKSNKSRGR